MQRRSTTGTIVGTVGAIVGVLVVVGLALGADEGQVLTGFIGVMPIVWLVGLVAAVIIGILVWVLLDAVDSADNPHPTDEHRCPGCNRALLRQWRMCPYCGTMLDREETVAESAPSVVSTD